MSNLNKLLQELQIAARDADGDLVRSLAEQISTHIERDCASEPALFCNALSLSVDSFDHPRTRSLCDALIDHIRTSTNPYPVPESTAILGILRRKRHFSMIIEIAEALMQSGITEPTIKKSYAQALIDSRQLTAAIDVLHQLQSQCEDCGDLTQQSEVKGLLGRAFKQRYINSTANVIPMEAHANDIDVSISYYLNEFNRDKQNLWHGINAVALLHRSKRDKLTLKTHKNLCSVQPILEVIQNSINSESQANTSIPPWEQATMAEACIAQNDFRSAALWIDHYVAESPQGEPRADAFEIASTLRQFTEIWQLDASDPDQATVLELLRSALLDRDGGSVSIHDAREESKAIDNMLDDSKYEQILGKDRFKNLLWYQTGLKRAHNVCKFVDRYEEGFGTGFLMKSADLGLPHSAEWIVLTNAHVISDDMRERQGNPGSLPPSDARVVFEGSSEPGLQYEIDSILAWSSRDKLDFTALTLKGFSESSDAYPIARHLPLTDKNQRVYVIGHPRGGDISFSLNDNLLLDYEVPRVHYRSPTEGGSSGSPIFNQNWELLGLHHAGGTQMSRLNGQQGHYPANEGLWIHSIRDFIKEQASTEVKTHI